MISCDHGEQGCNGGYLDKTWEFLHRTGTVSDACYPYSSGAGKTGKCHHECTGSGSWEPRKAA